MPNSIECNIQVLQVKIPLSYFEDKEASCMNAHYKVAPSADIKQKCSSLVFER